MPEIGDEFRAARLARHLSTSEVSEQLHIRAVYLDAIENQDWALIGAPVYVRGFVRTYARFLGLDPERAIAHYNAAAAGAGAQPERPERQYWRSRNRRPAPSPWLWMAALAAAVLVGFVGYNLWELRSAARGHPAVAQLPAAVPAGSPPPIFRRAIATLPKRRPVPAARTLEVVLTETSWLLVQIDGSKQLEGTFPPGTRKAFHGKLADVRTGNAGGVELTVNGKPLGIMGRTGSVVERSLALAEE